MPQIRLEYSTNAKDAVNPALFFPVCHQILVNTLEAELPLCQSRIIPCNQFYVGEGSLNEAFVYLEIRLMEGRPLSQIQNAPKQLLKLLGETFSVSLKEMKIHLRVHFLEIHRAHYFQS